MHTLCIIILYKFYYSMYMYIYNYLLFTIFEIWLVTFFVLISLHYFGYYFIVKCWIQIIKEMLHNIYNMMQYEINIMQYMQNKVYNA